MFSLLTLKYKPFKKYLVSSFDIENLVLSINLNNTLEFNVILNPLLSVSIIGKSYLGRQAKENLEPSALNVNNLPLLEIISISLLSSTFLTMSYNI